MAYSDSDTIEIFIDDEGVVLQTLERPALGSPFNANSSCDGLELGLERRGRIEGKSALLLPHHHLNHLDAGQGSGRRQEGFKTLSLAGPAV